MKRGTLRGTELNENEIPSWDDISTIILITHDGETFKVSKEEFGEYIVELIEDAIKRVEEYFK